MEINLSPGSLLTPRILYFWNIPKSTKCPVCESVWNCANCLHKEPQNTNMWTLHVFRYVSHVHKRRACPPDLSHTHPHNYYRMSAGWAAGALNPPVRQIGDYFGSKRVWFWLHILLQTKWRNGPPPPKVLWCARQPTRAFIYLFHFILLFFPPLEISCSFAQLRTYLQVYQPYALSTCVHNAACVRPLPFHISWAPDIAYIVQAGCFRDWMCAPGWLPVSASSDSKQRVCVVDS